MTSQEVMHKSGMALITVLKWAALNNVSYIGEGKRKIYTWTTDDYERFLNRNTQKGWKKGKPRKSDIDNNI